MRSVRLTFRFWNWNLHKMNANTCKCARRWSMGSCHSPSIFRFFARLIDFIDWINYLRIFGGFCVTRHGITSVCLPLSHVNEANMNDWFIVACEQRIKKCVYWFEYGSERMCRNRPHQIHHSIESLTEINIENSFYIKLAKLFDLFIDFDFGALDSQVSHLAIVLPRCRVRRYADR